MRGHKMPLKLEFGRRVRWTHLGKAPAGGALSVKVGENLSASDAAPAVCGVVLRHNRCRFRGDLVEGVVFRAVTEITDVRTVFEIDSQVQGHEP